MNTGFRMFCRWSLALIIIFFISVDGIAQQKKWLRYSIVNKGDTIGHMQMLQTISENKIGFSVKSDVSVKAILTFNMNMQEEAQFESGKLLFSSIKRYTNGKLKIDKQTKWSGDYYLLRDEGKEARLASKNITYNFSMLFYKEPIDVTTIYSDSNQKFFAITNKGNHTYQIQLPDNGVNTYYYENSLLKKVDLKNNFYSAQMLLN